MHRCCWIKGYEKIFCSLKKGARAPEKPLFAASRGEFEGEDECGDSDDGLVCLVGGG